MPQQSANECVEPTAGCALCFDLEPQAGGGYPGVRRHYLMDDGITLVLFFAAVFCAWNLYRGLRTGCTWLRGFRRTDRRDSPWSYWVVIASWSIFTAGFIAGFISELFGLGLVSRH